MSEFQNQVLVNNELPTEVNESSSVLASISSERAVESFEQHINPNLSAEELLQQKLSISFPQDLEGGMNARENQVFDQLVKYLAYDLAYRMGISVSDLQERPLNLMVSSPTSNDTSLEVGFVIDNYPELPRGNNVQYSVDENTDLNALSLKLASDIAEYYR